MEIERAVIDAIAETHFQKPWKLLFQDERVYRTMKARQLIAALEEKGITLETRTD